VVGGGGGVDIIACTVRSTWTGGQAVDGTITLQLSSASLLVASHPLRGGPNGISHGAYPGSFDKTPGPCPTETDIVLAPAVDDDDDDYCGPV
jgi:hypothetical protein